MINSTILKIILAINILSFSISEIVIDLHRDIDLSQETTLLNDISSKKFLATLTMGNNTKDINLVVNSDVHSYVIFKDNFGGLENVIPYTQNDSETLVLSSTQFENQLAKGVIAYDLLWIGDNSQTIKFPYGGEKYEIEPAESGTIGLDIKQNPKYDDDKYSFIKMLKDKDIISHYYFYLNYSDVNNAKLYIGGNYNSHKLHLDCASIDDQTKWALEFENVLYGGETLPNTKNIKAKIEIGDSTFQGNKEYHQKVYEDFFKYYIEKGSCHEITMKDYFTYSCDNFGIEYGDFKPLEFKLKKKNNKFLLDSNDLFLDDELHHRVFLVRFPTDESHYEEGVWHLGERFIEKFAAKFEIDSKELVFDIEIEEEEESYSDKMLRITLIVIIVLASLIIISAIFIYCVRTKKFVPRKRRQNIDNPEGYDYGAPISEEDSNN